MTRTLEDYVNHDGDCEARYCGTCHYALSYHVGAGGTIEHGFAPKPCSCGLDVLLHGGVPRQEDEKTDQDLSRSDHPSEISDGDPRASKTETCSDRDQRWGRGAIYRGQWSGVGSSAPSARSGGSVSSAADPQ